MGAVGFGAVARRAFKEAADFVRWPKLSAVVTAIAALIGAGALTYLRTGAVTYAIAGSLVGVVSLFGVVFVFKLFTVPMALANEAYAERDQISSDLADKVDTLERRIAELSAPPPAPAREPDGIYQHGELVGNAVGVRRINNTSLYHFDQINDQGHLDARAEFEYREWVLQATQIDAETKAVMAGAVNHAYFRVQARIIRRR